MTQHNRSTFLTLEEYLSNAEAQCLAAGSAMQVRLSGSDDELAPAWRKIADGEQQLAELFARFLRTAPRSLLDTQVQFIPDEREFSTDQASAGVAEEVLKMNHTLTRNIDQLSEIVTPEKTTGLLEDLQRNSASIARRVSMARVTMRDGGA